jgi:hypothetical protein
MIEFFGTDYFYATGQPGRYAGTLFLRKRVNKVGLDSVANIETSASCCQVKFN